MRLPLWPAFRVGAARPSIQYCPRWPRPGGKPGCNIPGIRQAALIPGGQPRLHQEGRMELGRERLALAFALRRMPRQALLVK